MTRELKHPRARYSVKLSGILPSEWVPVPVWDCENVVQNCLGTPLDRVWECDAIGSRGMPIVTGTLFVRVVNVIAHHSILVFTQMKKVQLATRFVEPSQSSQPLPYFSCMELYYTACNLGIDCSKSDGTLYKGVFLYTPVVSYICPFSLDDIVMYFAERLWTVKYFTKLKWEM